LRLADAPPEVRELVSLRKDTLSHAYELMKVEDPKKRKRLAAQVASGQLTLIKLRDRIEGRRPRPAADGDVVEAGDGLADVHPTDEVRDDAEAAWTGKRRGEAEPIRDDSLVTAKQQLAEAVEAMVDVLRAPELVASISGIDRVNLAKYLTIAKLRIENAIAMVRSDQG
jgi:hypothetical protein